MANFPMIKDIRIYNGEKTVSSVIAAGKTGQWHIKNENRTLSYTINKILNSKWIKNLSDHKP